MDSKKFPEFLSLIFVGLLIFFMVFPHERFSGNIIGHFLGIVGTLLMAATLIYVFRKRILKKKGKSNPLNPHVYYGLVGGILVVIHSGSKSASLIGVFVFTGMLLTILSGIAGRIWFVKLNRSIREQKSDIGSLDTSLKKLRQELNPVICSTEFKLLNVYDLDAETAQDDSDLINDPRLQEQCSRFLLLAESLAEREERLQVFTKTKKLFAFWNAVHIASTCFLFAMIAVHVITTVYYGLRWLP